MSEDKQESGRDPWTSNIWGWKWSFVSLIIILLFIGLAVCRYLVVKPDRLIQEGIEQDF
jgi:hypothetical protein